MSLESFYGGKQGISPVIKASFQYVDINDPAYGAALEAGKTSNELANLTMDIVLADSNYEDVWYNELCIINTTNKANKNNGKLYRRTLKGCGDTGVNLCAEYIGQIVGPPGANPFIAFKSIDEVNTEIHDDNYTINENTVISWPKTNGEEVIYSSEKPAEGVNPHVFSATTSNGMIVPGKDSDGNYNDNIRYTWFNIVDNTTEEETQSMVYLGFQIPYPSIDITTKEVDWDKNVESKKIPVKDKTGKEVPHPFYHSWNINIPRGIRGNAAGNIRLAKYEDFAYESKDVRDDKPFLYDYERSVRANNDTGSFIVSQTIEEDEQIVSTAPRIFLGETSYPADMPFWVYDYIFYDKSENESKDESEDQSENQSEDAKITKPYTFYLGSYKEIKDIDFDENGTITFTYSNTDKEEFEQLVRWIKEISIEDSGLITFTYNTKKNGEDNDIYSYQLPFPTSLNIDKDGEITVFLSGEEEDFELVLKSGEEDFLLNYVNSLSMDENSKVLSYTTFPNGKKEELNNGEGINYLQATVIDERYHLMMYHASSQFKPILNFENIGSGENPEYRYFDQYDNVFTLIGKDEELSVPMQLKNLDDNTSILIWSNGLTYKNGIEYTYYIETADTSFISGKTYYEFIDYREIPDDESSFNETKTYYEFINDKYIETEDNSFDENKTYYERIQEYMITSDEQKSEDKIYYELYSISGSDFWQDLGLVRQISQGLRVTHQFNLSSYPNQTHLEGLNHDAFISNVLNQEYWGTGIENPYYGGNILNKEGLINDPSLRGAFCYTPLIEDGTAYYYDYVDNSWRYVGKWDTSGTVDICIDEEKTGTKLSEYGVKLKTRPVKGSETDLPVFWQVN